MDRRIFPDVAPLAQWLGGDAHVETLPVHRDSPDWMFGSFWAHPERVLDCGHAASPRAWPVCPRRQ